MIDELAGLEKERGWLERKEASDWSEDVTFEIAAERAAFLGEIWKGAK